MDFQCHDPGAVDLSTASRGSPYSISNKSGYCKIGVGPLYCNSGLIVVFFERQCDGNIEKNWQSNLSKQSLTHSMETKNNFINRSCFHAQWLSGIPV